MNAHVVRNIYYWEYIKNSRAITVIWGIFTILFALLNVIVLIQPYWVGDSSSSSRAGYFGLYKYCLVFGYPVKEEKCYGSLTDFDSISSPFWKAATIVVASSCVLTFATIFLMFFFFCCRAYFIFYFAGFLQICAGLLLAAGVILYPLGWGDNPALADLCGRDISKYSPGTCAIRWTLVLAVASVLDSLILGILAITLGALHRKLQNAFLDDQQPNLTGWGSLGDGYSIRSDTLNRFPISNSSRSISRPPSAAAATATTNPRNGRRNSQISHSGIVGTFRSLNTDGAVNDAFSVF